MIVILSKRLMWNDREVQCYEICLACWLQRKKKWGLNGCHVQWSARNFVYNNIRNNFIHNLG